MKLPTAVEQACCILALLAPRTARTPMTNEALTKVMAVSPTYLKKITRKLVVAGLIVSTSGARGGFILGRPWRHITLHDVVEAIDGTAPFFQPQGVIERVFAGREREVELGMNIVETVFDEAQTRWSESLRKVTLEDIVKEVIRE